MKPWFEPLYWLASLFSLLVLASVGLLIAWLLVAPPPSYHRTGYFEFALPHGWQCQREGTETVCRPPDEPPHDAIIIFAAKYRNAQDSLPAYREHLAKPQQNVRSDGKAYYSKILRNEEREIGNYRWIDAIHSESEIPNYHTRYLATITAQIGVLITFSAHQSVAEARFDAFDACIESLRIYQEPVGW